LVLHGSAEAFSEVDPIVLYQVSRCLLTYHEFTVKVMWFLVNSLVGKLVEKVDFACLLIKVTCPLPLIFYLVE
jgi:hypothetical protein